MVRFFLVPIVLRLLPKTLCACCNIVGALAEGFPLLSNFHSVVVRASRTSNKTLTSHSFLYIPLRADYEMVGHLQPSVAF
jgi:hypothetical protein